VDEGHHLRQAHGYAYEHQIVAEQKLGRELLPDEVVHHRNGDRSDNAPNNLQIMTREEHAKIHIDKRDRDNLGRLI